MNFGEANSVPASRNEGVEDWNGTVVGRGAGGGGGGGSESDRVHRWRAEFEAKIAEKVAAEVAAMEEWRRAARREFDAWAKSHDQELAANRASNRESQEVFVRERDDSEHGAVGEWERVARLCDFAGTRSAQPKATAASKDVSRMRAILFRLKSEAPAVR